MRAVRGFLGIMLNVYGYEEVAESCAKCPCSLSWSRWAENQYKTGEEEARNLVITWKKTARIRDRRAKCATIWRSDAAIFLVQNPNQIEAQIFFQFDSK